MIRNFTSLPTTIYDSKLTSFLGKAEDKILSFSEFFGLKLIKTCDYLRYGFNNKLQKFRVKVLTAKETSSGFPINLEKEKEYIDLLINEGVIKEKITFKDKSFLYAKIAANSLFLTATSPISLSSFAAALSLRACVQNHMAPLTALSPSSYKVWDGYKPLRLFTANIAGTEFKIMDYLNGVTDTKPRIKEWGRSLTQLNADVICLQEAFAIDAIYPDLAKKLQEAGYYVVMTTKRAEVFGMTGGLLLASRYPIEEVGFHEFSDREGIDKRAAKGVLAASLLLNKKIKILVATTHMQAGYSQGTLEEKIKWKTRQFHQATDFIERFIEERDVRDVFLIGDFNDSRFHQKSISQGIYKKQYEAIVQGVLKKGFKDLTKPNCNDPFKDSYSAETEFDKNNPENVETGCAKGTCLNTASTSYHYFVPIIIALAKKRLNLPEKQVSEDVKRRLSKKDIGNEDAARIIDRCIKKVIKGLYVKPEAVDHICFLNKKGNVFDECGYTYRVVTVVGSTGIQTDHRNVEITLYPATYDL